MASLHVLNGKREGSVFRLKEDEVTDIGNRKSAKLSLRDPWVSFNHARVLSEKGRFVIEDQGSSNGTWINQKKVERYELSPNDVVYLGRTKIRFVADDAAGGEQPWWDRVLEGGDAGRLGELKAELENERRMRQALERFLELPPGSSVGEAARAGELEQENRELRHKLDDLKSEVDSGDDKVENKVRERTEKLRREHMSRLVEAEEKLAAKEAEVVELEGRLKAKTEQSKTELERLQERMDARVKELEEELEASRKALEEIDAGKDGAVSDELERLTKELEEARSKNQTTEDWAHDLESQLNEIKVDLDAKTAEADKWKTEHNTMLKEIDDISMDQIELEDKLQGRIKLLENRLRQFDEDLVPPPLELGKKDDAKRDGDESKPADDGDEDKDD